MLIYDQIMQLKLTLSGPTTFDGGWIERRGFLNSGPGLFLDKRFRDDRSMLPDRDDGFTIPLLPGANDLAAKSSPFD